MLLIAEGTAPRCYRVCGRAAGRAEGRKTPSSLPYMQELPIRQDCVPTFTSLVRGMLALISHSHFLTIAAGDAQIALSVSSDVRISVSPLQRPHLHEYLEKSFQRMFAPILHIYTCESLKWSTRRPHVYQSIARILVEPDREYAMCSAIDYRSRRFDECSPGNTF